MKKTIVFISLFLSSLTSCQEVQNTQHTDFQKLENRYEVAYFASGCFWCVEAIFESVKGVAEVVSGYSGGHDQSPTYSEVSNGQTGHAETVAIFYNSQQVNYTTLLKVFFGSHDPTTLNRQGPDKGTQYRSAIFYKTETEKKQAEEFISRLTQSGTYPKPIVTELQPFKKFFIAEAYHQNYEKDHPNHPYILNISLPRLRLFQSKFPEYLKNQH